MEALPVFTPASVLFVVGIVAYLYLTHGRASTVDKLTAYGGVLVAGAAAPRAIYSMLAPVLSGTHPAAWLLAGGFVAVPPTLFVSIRYDATAIVKPYFPAEG